MLLLRDRSGAAALEFALIASVFLLLLLGTIQIALLWWTENALQTTAMLTARCAALGAVGPCPNLQAAQAFAVSTAGRFTLSNAITASNVSVSSDSSCNAAKTGYSHFTMVTITSTVWANLLIAPLASTAIRASACYPSPTGS